MHMGNDKNVSLSKLLSMLPIICFGLNVLVGISSSCHASFPDDGLESRPKASSSLDIPTTQQLEDLIKTYEAVQELRLAIQKPYGDITKLLKTYTDEKFRNGAAREAQKNNKTLEDYRQGKALPSFEGMKIIQNYVEMVSKNYPLLIICAKITLSMKQTQPVNSLQGHTDLNQELSTKDETIRTLNDNLDRKQARIQELEQLLARQGNNSQAHVLNVQQAENGEEEQGNSSVTNKSFCTIFWDWLCSFCCASKSPEQQSLMAAKEDV